MSLAKKQGQMAQFGRRQASDEEQAINMEKVAPKQPGNNRYNKAL